ASTPAGVPRSPAAGGVARAGGGARPGGRLGDAFDHQRRPLELVLGTRGEAVGLEPPRDLERVEVRGVDLIERRVAGVADVATVAAPLAVPRAGLSGDLRDETDADARSREDDALHAGYHTISRPARTHLSVLAARAR